jgi:structure-specific recognition protein 1
MPLPPVAARRNIQRSEWGNLFEFIRAKKIPIENFGSAQHGPGGAKPGMEDDDMDPGEKLGVC